MTITVYSKPCCGPCRATQSALAKTGLEFDVVDISTDEDARDEAEVMERREVELLARLGVADPYREVAA